ncbi:alpha/beta hydrolase [Erysipelothrix rhusiopathiae]|nr:alpha/beta hydrolase [Erysipelothrix rhusiopathiae]
MSYFKFMGHEIFYEEFGMGDPLIFLHGNASSSDVFKPIIDLYKDDFKVVLIDFLGYGKSDQIDTFPLDIWAYEAAQVLELIHIKDYRDVKLVGMSGGAIVAVNIALKEPGRIHKIIADNFQGESSSPQFLESLALERRKLLSSISGKFNLRRIHGKKWHTTVVNETNAILEFGNTPYFDDLSNLRAPLLLTGCRDDQRIRKCHYIHIYNCLLKKVRHTSIYLFKNGKYPAVLAHPESFSDLAYHFFDDDDTIQIYKVE